MAAKDVNSSDIKKQEELEDITTCCICTEVYTDPKALPCIHTFCMKCLRETGIKSNKAPGDEMPCPICRRMFKIPPEGFQGLPNHFFIERLIQVSKVTDPSAVRKALCSLCVEESKEQEGKDILTADTYCVECKHKLCEECCNGHNKFKLTKKHTLIPINEYESGQHVMADLASMVCEVHEQKVLDVYCADCKTVVCAICFIEEHKNHEGSHVNKCVDGFRKEIEQNTEVMNECIAQAHMKKVELLKIKKQMQERVESLECDMVNRKFKHASSLLQSLCYERQSRFKEIQMATDDTDAYISKLESYNSYCQKIMDKGSASDICLAVYDLSVRAVELQQQCQPIIEREMPDFKFCSTQSEVQELLEEDCGNFVEEIEDELRYRSDPVSVQTITTKAVEEGKKSIRGLTILDKELFVVSRKTSDVEVYDSMKLCFSFRWILEELIDPMDIVSCNTNKCLYILDFKGSCGQSAEILRICKQGKLIKNWATGGDYGCGMSVTIESNVIFTVCEKHKLNEYSSDGQLIREINLSSDADIRHPFHAIKLTDGHFVVSHGLPGDDLHRVCIVNAAGKLKKSFGGKRGSTVGQVYRPGYLTVAGNGFVMVADQCNSRVLFLASDLEFKSEILSSEKHGIQNPWRILLDESNGRRLFVADNEPNNQRIYIYNF